MRSGLPGVSNPPSPLVKRGATTPDIPANPPIRCGEQGRHAATPIPHGSRDSGRIQTQPRRKAAPNETQARLRAWLAAFVLCLAFWALFLGSLFAAGAFGRCRTHRCFHRVHDKHVAHWLKEQRPWIYAWRHLSGWERTWARCIANHETRGIAWSRKRYVATGNGYYGGVQFLPSTWHNAGGSGLPTDHTLHEQLVRAVRWAHVAGSSQWSTSRYCGSV